MGVIRAGDGNGNGDGYGNGNGYGWRSLEVDHRTPILAWHFVMSNGELARDHGGQRPTVEPGLVLEWDSEVSLCNAGLHASLEVEQARRYQDGVLTRVACSGRVSIGRDKIVCSRREVIAVYPDGKAPQGEL